MGTLYVHIFYFYLLSSSAPVRLIFKQNKNLKKGHFHKIFIKKFI